jgi:hypothetical protein
MIKSHKQEMLSLLSTMGKMADLLPKLENPSEQVQDLFAACECLRENLEQESAPESLDLLQTIETLAKTDNYTSLQSHIKKLETAFKSEIKTKKETLFLPYKASMWDSLESIYFAAKEDPDCEAFVMPIPYYDKKSGQLAEMHWETDYPKNIPLIDYRKYNIGERRPDMIFVHNPYDGYNIVTSVHPDYFSQKLRSLTNCLVYVPYFVGDGKNIPEHFCTLPGCIFAHKVIVQTEEEKEIYAKVYKEFAKKSNVPEQFGKIADKFLALGSPKLDKVAAAAETDLHACPDEWQKLISNADGTRKKVVFYNTSIGTLLENTVEDNKPSDKYLQKVKTVHEFFKKQSDAVLLWRPHPLLEGTIKSMRPWIEQEYAEIVSEYKRESYGIYDDSSDLNRAIALSDVYYGDGSSVGKLFETAGKPVLIQVFGVPNAHGILADGDFVWFIDYLNILYRYDKKNKEMECMGIIPAQNFWAYAGVAANNDKLYFAPLYKNNKISIFDTNQKNFEQIDSEDNSKYDYNFNYTVSFKNFIYFVPHDFHSIMRLNTDTKKVEYFSEWMDEFSKLQVLKLQYENWKDLKFFNFCVVGTEIALVMHRANAVMFFNMETGGYEIKSIGEKSEQYHGICFDGQNYYLSSLYKDYIVKWNRQSNEILKIKIPSFSRRESRGANFLIQYLNEYVWLFPICANNAYKINVNTNEITELPELTEHFKDKNLAWYYNLICVNENSIYASTLKKGIVQFDTNTSELNFIKPANFEIDALSALLNYKNESNKTVMENKNSGKRIWEHLRGLNYEPP